MADVYCDMDLGTGNDDGTDWANAYKLFSGVSGNLSAGDTLWVQGSQNVSEGAVTLAFGGTAGNIVKAFGVKNGTTAEPPVQADLIPGLRTGNATRAYDQTSGDAPPNYNIATVNNESLIIHGHVYIYGITFKAGRSTTVGALTNSQITIEECGFEIAVQAGYSFSTGAGSGTWSSNLINCKIEALSTGSSHVTMGNRGSSAY